jgi:hypothetical protein
LKSLGRSVASNLAQHAKTAYQVRNMWLAFEGAMSQIISAESALAKGGWVLTGQVQQAKALSREAGELVKAYDVYGFHGELTRLVDTALANDQKYAVTDVAIEYWSSLDLSDFCDKAQPGLDAHVDACEKALTAMQQIYSECDAGRTLCEKLLDDDAIWAAEAVGSVSGLSPGILEAAWKAAQDFDQLLGLVGGPIYALKQHLTVASKDLQTVEENQHHLGWGVD